MIDKMPKYRFNNFKQRFERYFKEDWEKKEIYVNKKPKFDTSKNNINFFSVNPLYYPTSKIGLWNKLYFECFSKQFGKYIKLHQKEYTNVQKVKPIKRKDQKLFHSISKIDIYLVDKIQKPEHVKKIISVCKEEFYIDIKTSPEEVANAVNLRLIYNKESSKEKDLKKDTSFSLAIQNLTFNEYLKKRKDQKILKAYLRKVLVEAHQKFDISQKKLTVFDWQKLGLTTSLHFAIGENLILDNEQSSDIIHLLKVTPSGKLEFTSISSDAIDKDLLELAIAIFDPKNWDHETKKSRVAGFIMDSDNNINIIKETKIRTFPNLPVLHQFVMEGHQLKGEFLSTQIVLEFIEEFRSKNKPDTAVNGLYDYVDGLLDKEIEVIKIRELVSSSRTQTSFDFAMEFKIRFTYWIKFPVTNKEKVQEYYPSMVDINYIKKEKEVLFWAFKKMSQLDKKKLFTKSNVVRSLIPYGNSKLLFDHIVDTLNVDFVRLESPTVLPFPFKLLREYQKMADKDIILPVFDFDDFNI